MRILIVDDEVRNLKLLEAILSPQNYELVMAGDGESALRLLREQEIDMVLLDVMMPGKSGLEVLKEIREEENLKVLPVILITALGDKEYKIIGLKAGADDYITKPFDVDELLVRVNTQLKLSYLRRQLAEKEKLARVMESIEEGIIVTDRKLVPLTANAKARSFLEKEELPEDLAGYIKEKFRRDLLPLKEAAYYVLQRLEGEKYSALYLSLAVYPVKNLAGEIDSYVLTLRDITDQYQETVLKQDFLSLVSHKFRTPLTVMGAAIENINEIPTENEDQKDLLGMVGKEHKKMVALVERLLYFIEIEQRDLQERVELKIVEEIISKLMQKYKKVCVAEKEIAAVDLRLWQKVVMEELIENAFKFCDKETLALKLVLSEGVMEIADNGPGIPSEEKEKIFEPFYQLEKYFTGNVPGVGLGLALVKRLAELNKSQVEIQSVIGQGTKIRVAVHS